VLEEVDQFFKGLGIHFVYAPFSTGLRTMLPHSVQLPS
jgi:hypothetical protein